VLAPGRPHQTVCASRSISGATAINCCSSA
jgi:hypothetical protein